MSNNLEDILLVGTGAMSIEYVKVLKNIDVNYKVVGNTKESVEKFNASTGDDAYLGGIDKYISENEMSIPDKAIVAVNGPNLFAVTKSLILCGVKNILVEKPGCMSFSEIDELIEVAKEYEVKVYIAYNRRFYESVNETRRIIEDDGGLLACNFEFTEWRHVIEKTQHPDYVKQKWFLMNSSHVVDLVFHIAGIPESYNPIIKGALDWHKAGCNYAGSGITKKGVLFNYQANWNAPGRWGIEFLTSKHRLFLRPLEQLAIQNNGEINISPVEAQSNIDKLYKAGLYNEVCTFIEGDIFNRLCSLEEQKEHMKIYETISGEVY